MQVFTNLWGGEGYLTSASLIAMASVGMFNDVTDNANNNMDIIFRCLDFATESPDDLRWQDMYAAYENYRNDIFGDVRSSLIHQNIAMNALTNTNPPRVGDKYGNKEYLALGFSEDEMDLNITNGIYGKPWIGEAYYADVQFSGLYNDITSPDIIVINGGGYKGGGTAATFIYLENRYDVVANIHAVQSCKRFDAIVGPSTSFVRYIQLPYPEIYNETSLRGGIDIFEAGKILDLLKSKDVSTADMQHHNDNISLLESIWCQIVNYQDLNPDNYMPRFIDRVSSDTTLKNVTSFINMKDPLILDQFNSFNYDNTSPCFSHDGQLHRLHITNLLSAVSIQEIALNHNLPNYQPGDIYTFCNPNADKYTIESIFNPDDSKKLYRFIAFSTLIVKYIYNCFADITMPGAAIMLDKWAISEHGLLSGTKVILEPRNPKGRLNFAFASCVKSYLADLAVEYIKPVLGAFIDINDTSDQVQLFDDSEITESPFRNGLYGIVRNLIESIYVDTTSNASTIRLIDNPDVIKNSTEDILAAIITGRPGKPDSFAQSLKQIKGEEGVERFIEEFQKGIEEFGSLGRHNVREWGNDIDENNVGIKAKEYCQKLIAHAYNCVTNKII